MKEHIFTARCRAFDMFPVEEHYIRVTETPVSGIEVAVFDNMANHFTTCHGLTPWHISRFKAMAKRAWAAQARAKRAWGAQG